MAQSTLSSKPNYFFSLFNISLILVTIWKKLVGTFYRDVLDLIEGVILLIRNGQEEASWTQIIRRKYGLEGKGWLTEVPKETRTAALGLTFLILLKFKLENRQKMRFWKDY